MSTNRDYLERWSWKIGGHAYDVRAKPLHKRIDMARVIQRSLDEREALYMRLNGIRTPLADYWLVPEAQQKKIRQEVGKR